MEEDFELISKSELQALKEENNKLKKGFDSVEGISGANPNLINEISQLLTEEAKKERMFILKNLEEIKELNKQTLNNVLTRTEAMEFKMEDLVESLSKLVETVSEVITHVPKGEGSNKNDKTHDELRNSIDVLDSNIGSVAYKLSDLEEFMKNLKILLGQIKPSDMTFSKPQINNSNQTPANPTGGPPAFGK